MKYAATSPTGYPRCPAYTLAYDWMHNTTSYKAGAVTLAAFTYDGDGTRVTKTGNGTTTVYHTDKEGRTITETDTSGNLIADYVYVNGKLAAKKEPASLFFYHTDPTGTPLAMTDSTGTVAWKADYKPFGEELITAATKDNYKMFVGKEKDKETGLYYFGARYLQDKTARFVSVDPVGPVDSASNKTYEKMLLNPQKLNRYAYAGNNPYRYIDPWGLEWKDWQENIKATLEGTTKQNPSLKSTTPYGKNTDSDEFVALPDERLKGKKIEIEANGKKVTTEVGDVGPWNGGHSKKGTDFNDPYWDTNSRPQAETSDKDKRGRTTNDAGIDISAKLAEKLGLKGNSTVRWRGLP